MHICRLAAPCGQPGMPRNAPNANRSPYIHIFDVYENQSKSIQIHRPETILQGSRNPLLI
jgi:hypothetical protein